MTLSAQHRRTDERVVLLSVLPQADLTPGDRLFTSPPNPLSVKRRGGMWYHLAPRVPLSVSRRGDRGEVQ